MFAGAERRYLSAIPAKTGSPPGLLLNFHGFASTAQAAHDDTALGAAAAAAGLVVVSPEGAGAPPRWSVPGSPAVSGLGTVPEGDDPIAFVDALLDHLGEEICFDRARIFAAGFSNGGELTTALACERRITLRAIAVVAGVNLHPCEPAGPVPMIVFHGTADPFIPFEGGKTVPVGGDVLPVRDAVARWARSDGCDRAEESSPLPGIARIDYGRCENGSTVVLYQADGFGHTWPGHPTLFPGGGETPPEPDATALIVEFFDATPAGRRGNR